MAAPVDPQLLVRAFLRHAERQPDPRAWLDGLHAEAVAAVASGDRFVTTTAFDGESSTMERRFDAAQLLTILEACQSIMDQQESGDGNGAVTVSDFSGRRSEWG